jgi:hypothetical protein
MYIFFRYRHVEKYLYELQRARDGKSFETTSLTDMDVRYLIRFALNRNTNEIKATAPRQLVKFKSPDRGTVRQLEFKAFKVREYFAQNVVVL